MSRRGARRNAFYLLFQMDFSEAEEFEQVKELFFAEKEEPVEEEDKEFILSEVEGVHAHMAEIDEMITASANGWDPARMNKVDIPVALRHGLEFIQIEIFGIEYFRQSCAVGNQVYPILCVFIETAPLSC